MIMVQVKTFISIIAMLLLSSTLLLANPLGGAVLLNENDAQQIFAAKNTGSTNDVVRQSTLLKFFKGQFQIAIYQKDKPVITKTITELSFDSMDSKDIIDAYIDASIQANSIIDAEEIVLPDAKLGVNPQKIEESKKEIRNSILQLTQVYILTYLSKYGGKPSQKELQNQIEYLITQNQNEIDQLNTQLKQAQQDLTELNGAPLLSPSEEVNNQLTQYLSLEEKLNEKEITELLKSSNLDPQIVNDVQKEVQAAQRQAAIVLPKIRKLQLNKNTKQDPKPLIQLIDAYRTMQRIRTFAKFEKYFNIPQNQRKQEDFQNAQLSLLKYYQNDPEVLLALKTNNALTDSPAPSATAKKQTTLTPAKNAQIEELKKDIKLQEQIIKDYGDLIEKEDQQRARQAATKLADDYQQLTQLLIETTIDDKKADELLTSFKDSSFYTSIQKILNPQSTPDYFIVIYPAQYTAQHQSRSDLPADQSSFDSTQLIQFTPKQIISNYAKTSGALIQLNDGTATGQKYIALNGQAFTSPLGTYSEENLVNLFYEKGYSQGGFKVIQAVYYDQNQLENEDDLKGQTDVLVVPTGNAASIYQIPVEISFNEITASTFKATRANQLQQQIASTNTKSQQLQAELNQKIAQEGQQAYRSRYQEVLLKFKDNPNTDEVRQAAQFAASNAKALAIRKLKDEYSAKINAAETTYAQLQSTYVQESTETTDVPVVEIKLPVPNYAIKQLAEESQFNIISHRLQIIAANSKYSEEATINIPELKTRTYQNRLSSIIDYKKPGDYKIEITHLGVPLKLPSVLRLIRVEGNGAFQIYTPNNDAAKLYGAATQNRDLLVYSVGMKQTIPSSELYLTNDIGKTLEKTDLTDLLKINDISFANNKIKLVQFKLNPTTSTFEPIPVQDINGIPFNTKIVIDKYEFTPQSTRNNGIVIEVQSLQNKVQLCSVIQKCENNQLSIKFTMPASFTKLKVQQSGTEKTTKLSKTTQDFTISTDCETKFDYYAITADETTQQKCEIISGEFVKAQNIFLYGIEGTSCTNAPIQAKLLSLKDVPRTHTLITDLNLAAAYDSSLEYYLEIIRFDPLLLQMPQSQVDEITPNLNVVLTNKESTENIKILRKDDRGKLVFIKVIPSDIEPLPKGKYVVQLFNSDEQIQTFGSCNNQPLIVDFGLTFTQQDIAAETPQDLPATTQTDAIDEILEQKPESKIVDPFQQEINTKIQENRKAAFDISAPGVDTCNLNSKVNLLDLISQNLPDGAAYFHVYTGTTVNDYPIATVIASAPGKFAPFYTTNPQRYSINRKVPLTIQFKDKKDKVLLTLCGLGPLQK